MTRIKICFWTYIWCLCMVTVLPFVFLARFGRPFEYLLFLLAPVGDTAGYAYRRMFKEYYSTNGGRNNEL